MLAVSADLHLDCVVLYVCACMCDLISLECDLNLEKSKRISNLVRSTKTCRATILSLSSPYPNPQVAVPLTSRAAVKCQIYEDFKLEPK